MCFNVRFSMQMLLVDVNFLSLKCSSLGHSSSYVLVKSDLPTQVSQFGEHCVTHCVLLLFSQWKASAHVTWPQTSQCGARNYSVYREEQSERRTAPPPHKMMLLWVEENKRIEFFVCSFKDKVLENRFESRIFTIFWAKREMIFWMLFYFSNRL